MAEANWYVVHTYSGYENKVKANIDKTIQNRHLENEILEVRVPLQDVVEMKNGAKKTVQKKMFPGYVLINMVMNDDTWYVVRNTRGVTGFVGPGSKPVPLTEAEMRTMGIAVDTPVMASIDAKVGEMIKVITGAWEGSVGEIKAINDGKQVAYLAPTTVLANQHYNTFLSRMGSFGAEIGLLSRFCQKKEIIYSVIIQ